MKKSILVGCLVVFAGTASGQAGGCVTTLFAANNSGSAGGAIYFDIEVLNPNGVCVTNFETNTETPGPFDLTVYITPGTSAGNENNMAVWTLAGMGSGVGAGLDVPSPVDTSDFTLAAGMYGMALVMSASSQHNYTNGDGSNQSFGDANIWLTLGSATNVPFTGNIFMPRVWNGTICYEECPECLLLVGFDAINQELMPGDHLLVNPLLWWPVTIGNCPWFHIPNDPALLGYRWYAQVGMLNYQVFPNDPLQLSNGLDITIGGQIATYGPPSSMTLGLSNPNAALGTTFTYQFSIAGL